MIVSFDLKGNGIKPFYQTYLATFNTILTFQGLTPNHHKLSTHQVPKIEKDFFNFSQ